MMGIRQICHGDGWWRVICILDYWGVVMVVIQCFCRFRVLSSSGSRDFDVQTTHQR